MKERGPQELPSQHAEKLRQALSLYVAPLPEPDLDRAWAGVQRRVDIHRRRLRRRRVLAAAAAALLLAVVPVAARSEAVPALVARLEDTWLYGTLRNLREYLSPGSRATPEPTAAARPPEVLTQRYGSVEQAAEATRLSFFVPTWLPPQARLQQVVVTWMDRTPLLIGLWYALPGNGFLLVEEHIVQQPTSFGSFYDTDDAEVVPVSVGGVPGTLCGTRAATCG